MSKRKRKKFSKGTFATVFLAAVPLLLLVYWVYSLGNEPKVQVEKDHFVFEIPNYYQLCETGDPLYKINEIKEGFSPEQIVIESVGINLPIVPVPLENGTWEVIDSVANYALGTSLVNPIEGNVGIYGHDRDYVFSPVKNLKNGDEIFIFAKDYMAVYIVRESMVLEPEKVDVFYPTENPILTLVTCEGVFSQRRYALVAEFDRIVQLNCE